MSKTWARNYRHFLRYRKEILFFQERAGAAWMAAVSTEPKLKERRKESDHNRQVLAKFKSQPFPAGPFALAAPPQPREAWKCQATLWVIRPPPRKGDGHAESPRIGVTCRFDSAAPRAGFWFQTPTTAAQQLCFC